MLKICYFCSSLILLFTFLKIFFLSLSIHIHIDLLIYQVFFSRKNRINAIIDQVQNGSCTIMISLASNFSKVIPVEAFYTSRHCSNDLKLKDNFRHFKLSDEQICD